MNFGLANFGFWGTVYFVGFVCGLIFFAGLRVFRCIYGGGVWPRDHLSFDLTLSLAIMGAEAFFVGTTPPPDNIAGHPFGIFEVAPTDTIGVASLKAGGTTAVGFVIVQVVLNFLLPYGIHWVDPAKPSPEDFTTVKSPLVAEMAAHEA